MDFLTYQKKAEQTIAYPSILVNVASRLRELGKTELAEMITAAIQDVRGLNGNLGYVTMGLAGEAGEISNKVKKIFRDNGGRVSEEMKQSLGYELGDVLWYVAATARELGLDMNDIAEANIDKLFSRKERGVLQGDGDQR